MSISNMSFLAFLLISGWYSKDTAQSVETRVTNGCIYMRINILSRWICDCQ